MEENHKLTKKEKKELRKIEWQEKAKLQERNEKIKKYSIWAGVVTFIVLVIGALVMLVNTPSKPTIEAANIAPVSEKDITKGKKDAKITLIEYSDFQCPACAAYHPLVTRVMEEYANNMLFVYRMFPLTNIHANAKISGQAAYAANKQGKFFEMGDLLFSNQKDWENEGDPRGIFMDYARKLKLDAKKFQDDMNSNEAKKYVEDAEKQALSEGMNQTPSFIVNGNKISNPGNYEEFKKLLDDELNKK
jgi:protein-disulfide isomerase